jgi:hypothetical protein
LIKIINIKLAQDELVRLCKAHFITMIKFVVDIDRGKMAVGGEMNADGEALLLEEGSCQSDLWGGNFYPWKEADHRIEYTSFINIRPMDDNLSMEIQNEAIQQKVKWIVERLLMTDDETMSATN